MSQSVLDKEAIHEHTAPNESIETTYRWANQHAEQFVALTDRRLISIYYNSQDTQDTERVETVVLDRVSRTSIERKGDEPSSTAQAIAGAVIGAVGFVGMLIGAGESDQALMIVYLSAGLAAVLLGAWAVLDAYSTDDGYVALSLQTSDDPSDMRIEFPLDRYEFATDLNERLGSRL